MKSAEFNITAVASASSVGERFQQFWSKQFFRYFAISFVALTGDAGLLLVLTELAGVDVTLAAATAFLFGAMLNYYLSIMLVFQSRALNNNPMLEALTFVAIGLIGLGITEVVIHALYTGAGLPLFVAKFLAAGLTFVFNYLFRKILLFTVRQAENE